jgi:hypothetical protein
MMLNVAQLPHARITASTPGLSTRRPTSKAVCGSRRPISRLRMNPSVSCARTVTPFASRNAATVWLTGALQGAPRAMRLAERTCNASSSAVEAVVAGFPLAADIRLISSWSYPMPLRAEGAVAGKTITSTSTSASFWLSISISWTIRSVDSDSTLLNRIRATCSVMSSGSALQKSRSCTELEDGTSKPIRRKSCRCAIGTSSLTTDAT